MTNTHTPPHDQRVIRVFISSTFKDMAEEREKLVKYTFPELRRRCRERQVEFVEVDLRWGITDEQKTEDKVLPICMEEIKRCHPFFVGLLGERYGWAPEKIDPDFLEKQDWLKGQEGQSFTALEILHGVLNNPAMAGHSFFYFRDPAYVNSIPEKDRKDFVAESAKGAEKLMLIILDIWTSKW